MKATEDILNCCWKNSARSYEIITLNYNPSYVLAPSTDFCAKHDYLVVYQTRLDDTEKRNFFRKTFHNYAEQYNFTILFPVGLSWNSTANEGVAEEHKRCGDILQADFLDTYRNLTFKTYAHSHYITRNCTNVRFVVKIDDDIAWNVRLMFDYLSNVTLEGNTLHCRTVETPLVDRNSSSKWYVSEEEYSQNYFPEYCLSPIYAATPYTITKLHDKTNNAPHIWVDDVFSTGLVGREAGVSFKNLSVNVDWHDYAPFLKGTVVAQYLNSLDDMSTLLQAVDSNNSSSLNL
ncbi:hypothetical protein Aduo_007712 [Ancylostoma duodenale]